MSKTDEDIEKSAQLKKDDEKAPLPSSPKALRKQVIDVACILLNIISTVTLVFLNKWYLKISLLKNKH